MVLKLVAGDRFNLRATSWYSGAGSYGSPQSPLTQLLDLLNTAVSGASGGKVTSGQLATGSTLQAPLLAFLGTQSGAPTTKPKAFLNWVLVDERFQLVSASSGSEQVGASGAFTTHQFSNLPIAKNGYLYVFVSNETPNQDVYFDNLQVRHIRGPIVEETHYYPYGISLHGISTKAAQFAEPRNKIKFNGIEQESALNIEIYDAHFRELDGQIGRWWQIDPKVEGYESASPFASMNSDPIRYSDPLGDEGAECCGEFISKY